ncbi:MAG: type II toxin-antitoxin system VapC family toxin [Candidatus Bathyarchaeia archaeon]
MRRFVDTNVFIYVLTKDPRFFEVSQRILGRIEKGEEAVTSTVVVDEACVFLEMHGRSREIPVAVSSIRSYVSMEVVSFTLKDMAKASELVEQYKMGWHDCLNIAVMKRLGVEEIYSNDRHFDRVEGIRRIFA